MRSTFDSEAIFFCSTLLYQNLTVVYVCAAVEQFQQCRLWTLCACAFEGVDSRGKGERNSATIQKGTEDEEKLSSLASPWLSCGPESDNKSFGKETAFSSSSLLTPVKGSQFVFSKAKLWL